jgi:hypothetical protein
MRYNEGTGGLMARLMTGDRPPVRTSVRAVPGPIDSPSPSMAAAVLGGALTNGSTTTTPKDVGPRHDPHRVDAGELVLRHDQILETTRGEANAHASPAERLIDARRSVRAMQQDTRRATSKTPEALMLDMSDVIAPDGDRADAIHGARPGETRRSDGPYQTASTSTTDTDTAYAPMRVAGEDGVPVVPAGPIMDRRDAYRLVMAHRRRDPRTSSAIMDAAGVSRLHANPMLNHGRPGNDASLVAVAALYGVPIGFETVKGVRSEFYEGLDPDDVRGPEVLSRSAAGRLGSIAQKAGAGSAKSPGPRSTMQKPREDGGADQGDDEADLREDSRIAADMIDLVADFAERLLATRRRERRAIRRAAEADLREKSARAAAIASGLRAKDAEDRLSEARTILRRTRRLLES